MTLVFPARIGLGDVVLRHWTSDDVPTLVRAVRESYEHLHPWMSWATPEGITSEAMRGFIDAAERGFAEGTESVFGVFTSQAGNGGAPSVLGGCGLHDRGTPGTIEIGYWLHVDVTGAGLMTRVAAALGDAALAMPGIDRVEIRCDEANTASAAVARRAGFELVSVQPADRPGGPACSGNNMIWVHEGDAVRVATAAP